MKIHVLFFGFAIQSILFALLMNAGWIKPTLAEVSIVGFCCLIFSAVFSRTSKVLCNLLVGMTAHAMLTLFSMFSQSYIITSSNQGTAGMFSLAFSLLSLLTYVKLNEKRKST